MKGNQEVNARRLFEAIKSSLDSFYRRILTGIRIGGISIGSYDV